MLMMAIILVMTLAMSMTSNTCSTARGVVAPAMSGGWRRSQGACYAGLLRGESLRDALQANPCPSGPWNEVLQGFRMEEGGRAGSKMP